MRQRIAILLVACAAALHFWSLPTSTPPSPPSPALEIDLTGAFIGPTASTDAALLASMSDEVASVIEWDGAQPEPLLKTGRSLDRLRIRTREFLLRGESIGERQPKVRQIVGDFLDTHLGDSPEAITPEQRAAWVSAYREIARSARHAISR